MNSSVKKLTEAAILSSTFIVITMIALSTGLGYGLYLDFGVPIIFALIYFRCEFKYTLMCGISSVTLILLILGNFAAAILVSQSFLLGILCGYLITKASDIFDDLFLGSIVGVIFMILIDIYARNIIGYSFMEEFQGYIDYFNSNPTILKNISKLLPFIKINLQVIYYLFIAVFPFGMIFSIYFISIMLGKKLRILNENGKRKYFMMRSIRNYSNFMCMKKEYFYYALGYVALVSLLRFCNIQINNVYLDTIITCVEYLSLYFIFRDGNILIGNYINIKYKKKSLSLLYFIITIVSFFSIFRVAFLVYAIVAIFMDKRFNLREKQKYIVDTHTEKLMIKYKI